MMLILVLILVALILYRFLFSKFGLMPGGEQRKREEAVASFVKKITGKSDGEIKKLVVVGDREVLEEIYGSRNELGILPDGELRVAVENEKFDEQAFLRASERAVVTILDAFSDRRIDILQKLLMKDLFEVLREKIENMGENILKLVVVSFEEKNIVEKIMRNKSNEVITVKLKIAMRQVNYIEDKDHNVVSGSKSKMRKVLEEWTFVKSQSEKRGVWLLKSLNRCSSV